MIRGFKCKETEKIFNRNISLRLPLLIQRTARRKLIVLDSAPNIGDLKLPLSNHFKKLKGINGYSIRINKQWRICFQWENSNSYNVEIIDYH
jgi:toxin HigB-1